MESHSKLTKRIKKSKVKKEDSSIYYSDASIEIKLEEEKN